MKTEKPKKYVHIELPIRDAFEALCFVDLLDRISKAVWATHGDVMAGFIVERQPEANSVFLQDLPELDPDNLPF